MAETARLEARATLDDADFQAGLNRMEARGKSFSDRLTGLFKRASGSEVGEIRAERALSGFVSQLTTGNIPGAIESITYRLSGLGLAAGVGIGAAAIAFAQIKKALHETHEASMELDKQLAKPIGAEAGTASIRADIQATVKAYDDLITKAKTPFATAGRGVMSFIEQGATFGASSGRDRTQEITDQLAKSLGRVRAELAFEADAEQKLVDIRRMELTISQDQAAIEKIRAAESKKVHDIESQNVDFKSGLNKLVDEKKLRPELAENLKRQADLASNAQKASAGERAQLDIEEQDRKSAIHNMELNLQGQVADIAASSLPAELQKTATIEARISALREELSITTEVGEREKLQAEMEKASSELRSTSRSDEVKRFAPLFEKSQLSFQELLGSPSEREGGSPRLARAKSLAGQAQHEEQLGAGLRDRGDIEGAFKHFLEAERIKSEIPQLSDKEKMPEYAFKSALGRTEEILGEIRDAFQGKEAISLSNQ